MRVRGFGFSTPGHRPIWNRFATVVVVADGSDILATAAVVADSMRSRHTGPGIAAGSPRMSLRTLHHMHHHSLGWGMHYSQRRTHPVFFCPGTDLGRRRRCCRKLLRMPETNVSKLRIMDKNVHRRRWRWLELARDESRRLPASCHALSQPWWRNRHARHSTCSHRREG